MVRVHRNGLLYNDVGITRKPLMRDLCPVTQNPAHIRVTLNLPTIEQLVNVELIDMLEHQVKPLSRGMGTRSPSPRSAADIIARIRTGSAVFIARIIKN